MSAVEYLRKRFMPHIWCPGCGHGIVMGGLLRAVERLQIEKNDIVMVSGIGCSSRISGYVDFHTLNTLHGRALAFATGVKLGRPELTAIVPMGDGDALAIGGNHFIHAARRNIDMTAVIMNNSIYGMTGGQFSPFTGCGEYATTAPYGTIDQPFDAVELARAAGASFIARSTTYHVQEMTKFLMEAIRHKGFSVVEILSQCPTYYGRKNRKGSAVEMMQWYRDHTRKIDSNQEAGGSEREGYPAALERGIFYRAVRPEYCETYEKMVAGIRGNER
jgi:2-oxoglutarate ferredoxin oxidoreductase subunit beta